MGSLCESAKTLTNVTFSNNFVGARIRCRRGNENLKKSDCFQHVRPRNKDVADTPKKEETKDETNRSSKECIFQKKRDSTAPEVINEQIDGMLVKSGIDDDPDIMRMEDIYDRVAKPIKRPPPKVGGFRLKQNRCMPEQETVGMLIQSSQLFDKKLFHQQLA